MSEHKLTIYLKGTGKAIVITDRQKSMDVEEIKDKIKQLMTKTNTVAIFETSDDFVIIKSEDVSSIMFSAPGQIITEPSIKDIVKEKLDIKPKSKPQPKPEHIKEEPVVSECVPEELLNEKTDSTSEDGNEYEQILIID